MARGADPGARDLVPAVLAFRERARTLVEMAAAAAFLYLPDDALERDPAAVTAFLNAANLPILHGVHALLEASGDWTEPALEAAVVAWCAAEGLKLGKVAQPVRVALCGQKVGPGLSQTLVALGREASLRRLRAAVDTARATP